MKKLLLVLTLALCATMTFAQSLPSNVPTDGLVGYWPFNGNANDESGNNNNGTVNGATLTTDRFGNSNSSYIYNSGDNLICTSQIFNSPNSLTYAIWFKTNSTIGGFLMGFNNGQCTPGNHWDRQIWIENDKVVFYTFPGFQYTHQASINVIDNNWHHCVVTMNNQGSKIYIDGMLISTNTTQNIGYDYMGYFRFGAFGGLVIQPDVYNSLLGTYDDIAIYNRALTQEEINQLYYTDNTCQSLVINTGVLSFNPPKYSNTVTIYPNPANDHITIDCGNLANVSGWSIKIYNTLGQEVFSGAMNTQQYVVPLNTWSGQGVYFVKIYDASNQLMNTKKIILQ